MTPIFSDFPEKNKITIRDICRVSGIRLIKALRNPRAPTVSEGRYRGMADSASYATCGHRAATQDTAGRGLTSTLWPPNFEKQEPQLEDKSENDLRISQARSGRRPARWNLVDRAWPTVGEIGISQAGSGFGP